MFLDVGTNGHIAPCRHGVDHPHGSVGRARSDGCRCHRCGPVARAYDEGRRRARAYGTWDPWVDASVVAAHLRELAGRKTLAAIAETAGVNRWTLTEILAGRTKRVRAANAEAILAVQAEPACSDPFVIVDAAAASAAVQDRVAHRWPLRTIADTAGVSPATVRRVMAARQHPARPVRVRAWVGDALETLPRCSEPGPQVTDPDAVRTHPLVRSAAEMAACGKLAAEQRRAAVAVLTQRRVGAARAATILHVSERTVWRDRAALAA